MKLAFIDFLDSFSYNVIQELTNIGFEVDIYQYPEHKRAWEYDFLALGPGPGHPNEYNEVISLMQARLKNPSKKTFGLCLGHQLIWRSLGFEVKRSLYPLHGQKIEIELDSDWQKFLSLPSKVEVQRYNSLVVDLRADRLPEGVHVLFSQNELMMSRADRWLSYQFHPESVGTSFQKSFFSVVPQV